MTEFETHLCEVPVREIPAHWRAEILAAAEAQPGPSKRACLLAVWCVLRNGLWPHPAAWAALAACWFFAALLFVSGPSGTSLSVVTPPGLEPVEITPESYALYRVAVDRLLEEQAPREQRPLDRSKL